MKNIKYFAGFFDADGSFDIRPVKRERVNSDTFYEINLKAVIYQKDIPNSPLHEFAKEWGVEVKSSIGNMRYVSLQGSKARRFMEQVKNHLVVKKNVVEFLLAIDGLKLSKEELPELRKAIKKARNQISTEKNFPSRQWLAGYFDGDGCVISSLKATGVMEFKMYLTSHSSQIAGLNLIHKMFGGNIHEQGEVRNWVVGLSQTKAEQVVPYFIKHSKIKRQQLEYVLGIIRSKEHFRRNGATHKSNLKIHRLLQSMKRVPATTKS